MNSYEYQRSAEVIEITIRDGTRAKIETRKASMQDEKAAKEMARWLYQKYGYKLEIPVHGETKDGFFDW